MPKLPIGIQSFEKLRSEDYLYVDNGQVTMDNEIQPFHNVSQ
jgi:hypothetical protein